MVSLMGLSLRQGGRKRNKGGIHNTHMGLKQGAQAFTGAPTTCPDTFPHVNAAHDLTNKIGVTKNSLNLKS